MKNRPVPFGYRFCNGSIIQDEDESQILFEICEEYCSGKSLLAIADKLNNQTVEYMPGVVGWNKARIKRIIEDTRYLGESNYPRLIDEDTYERMRLIKSGRNTQTNTDRSMPIFKISMLVKCPICGSGMIRRYDKRCKEAQRWTCSNSECKTVIPKVDAELVEQVTELLNQAIAEPQRLRIPDQVVYEPSREARKLKAEIDKKLNGIQIDRDELRNQMMSYLAQLYHDIRPEVYTAKRMKAEFERAGILAEFSPDLFERTVQAVTIEKDASVSIVLINGQIIRKELPNGYWNK